MVNIKHFDNIDCVLLDPNIKDRPITICLKTNEARLAKQYSVKDAMDLASSIVQICNTADSTQEGNING